MRSICLPIMLLAAVAGCKQEGADPALQNQVTASASATPKAVTAKTSASANNAVGGAVAVAESNDLYEFSYGYPAAAGAIAGLKVHLDGDMAKQKAELIAESKAAKAEAGKDSFEYRPFSRSYDWEVVTELPQWLSLSSLVSNDSGGAHPNYWFDAILWDKAANKQRDAVDMFTSKAALTKALQKDFCAEIDRQRAKKRGEDVVRSAETMFSECLDPAGYTVILGSSDRKLFNRIGILVPPYEAGPYAEGAYEVTLPVTAAVLAAVKPVYKGSFATRL